MEDVSALLARWQITPADAREQIYRVKSPRERERWHALWLLSRGWPAAQVAQALERDAHTIGEWLSAFARMVPRLWPSRKVVAPLRAWVPKRLSASERTPSLPACSNGKKR